MSVLMKARELRWRLAGHYTRPLGEEWTAPLGGTGLEIGGPSALFRSGGLWPVYPRLDALDGVQSPHAHVLWHGELREGPYETGEPGLEGQLWLREGSDLGHLADESYDVLLSSHVLEHFANPVGALREWLRLLRPGGWFVMVLPHKSGCGDHRRPTTTLDHMVEDDRRGTGEDDMTHAEEVTRLHDIDRALTAPSREALEERVRDNPRNRAMHHHVFTGRSALRLLDHAGLELRQAEVRWPHDIYALATWPEPGEPRPDNSAMLDPGAAFLRRSPFPADAKGEG